MRKNAKTFSSNLKYFYRINPDGQVFRENKYGAFEYKPIKDERGYYYVRLDGDRFYYHRLVAQHFLPNPEGLPCVRHKDGDRRNNSVTNLEWCKYTNKKRA